MIPTTFVVMVSFVELRAKSLHADGPDAERLRRSLQLQEELQFLVRAMELFLNQFQWVVNKSNLSNKMYLK